MEKTAEMFQDLMVLIRILRGEGGCPWDRRQTLDSITAYLKQESGELLEALAEGHTEKIREEMGDLLFLLFFAAEIAGDQGDFTLDDVLEGVKRKMVRRHPHVFGPVRTDDIAQIRENWQEIKARERALSARQSLLDPLPQHLSPLLQAVWVTQRASEVGFDWDRTEQVLEKMMQEIEEFREAWRRGDQAMLRHELGDLFFTCVNLSRFLKVNPEKAVSESVQRFIRRFQYLEERLREENKDIRAVSLADMDTLWEEAKTQERP